MSAKTNKINIVGLDVVYVYVIVPHLTFHLKRILLYVLKA